MFANCETPPLTLYSSSVPTSVQRDEINGRLEAERKALFDGEQVVAHKKASRDQWNHLSDESRNREGRTAGRTDPFSYSKSS